MANSPIAAYTDGASRDASIETHGFLVKRIAHHLMARLPETVQVDDLIQAGMVGLLEALAKYDPSKGASFATYAGIRIRGAMLDEVRRGDWAPRSVHRNSRRVAKAIAEVEHSTGRTAADKDVAEAMSVSLDEYYKILRDASSCRLFSFEQVNESDDPSILPTVDYSDHGAELTELLQNLSAVIARLPERERLVMSLYYDEELNLKEIGSILSVSESRVSQILSQATLRVRSHISHWMES